MQRPIVTVLAVAIGAVWLCGAWSSAVADGRAPATHTVTIDGTRFMPDALTVKAGDTIVWVNKDPFPHTVTSKKGGFDSQAIAAGESWRHVAATAGEFPYVCTFHPTMKARLTVK